MNESALTPRQEAIMNFIIKQVQLKGYPPSVREIGLAVGLQSSSTVHNHLNQLEKKGYIMRDPTKPRAIMILRDTNGHLISDEELSLAHSTDPVDEIVNLPLIGTVAAGSPILAEENLEDTISFPMRFVRHNGAFMLKIKGESMIEAGILDGDYIIVAPQTTANNGDIIVAMIDGEATCKTFYREKNRVRLQPENSSMQPIYTTEASIIGKVISLFRPSI